MDDQNIVELYVSRSEQALAETQRAYGAYCFSIAYRILSSREDAEECVNDVYLKVWNSIPPHRPSCLRTFLGKLTRNTALSRYTAQRATKRGGGQVPLVLEELRECLADTDGARMAEDVAVQDALSRFLRSLSTDNRRIFLQRYWYLCSVEQIAREMGVSVSKVKMSLLRTRQRLKQFLENEGIGI